MRDLRQLLDRLTVVAFSTTGITARRRAVTRAHAGRPRSVSPTRRLVDLVLGPARRRRGVSRWRASLPPALEDLARSLRSGASVVRAIGEVAASPSDPARADFARLHARLRAGDDLATALGRWNAGTPDGAGSLTAAALMLASEQGGSRAWAVDQVAATFRERSLVDGELRSLAAQARLSALVVGLAPLAFGGLVASVDPRVFGFFVTPLGLVCLLIGALLEAGGAWWMTALVRRAR